MDKLQVPGIIVREVPKKCQRDWCKIQSRRINEENIIDWLFERLATITTLSLEDCLLLLLLVCAVAIFAMPSLFSSRNKHCIDAKHTDSLEEAAQFWEECQSDCLEHKCVELTVRAVQLLKLLHKKVRDMKKNSITSADRMKVIVFLEKLENKLQAMVEALTDYRTTANLHPEILLQFVEAGQAISLSKRCAQMVRETLQTDDIDAYFEKRRNELLSESKKAAKVRSC